MRAACQLASKILCKAKTLVRPGVTTDYIDSVVHEEITKHGAYPSPLNYLGFPKVLSDLYYLYSSPLMLAQSVCTSVNEVLCHGIPDSRALREGEIVNIDVTVYLGGFHGDCSATFPVGNIVLFFLLPQGWPIVSNATSFIPPVGPRRTPTAAGSKGGSLCRHRGLGPREALLRNRRSDRAVRPITGSSLIWNVPEIGWSACRGIRPVVDTNGGQ